MAAVMGPVLATGARRRPPSGAGLLGWWLSDDLANPIDILPGSNAALPLTSGRKYPASHPTFDIGLTQQEARGQGHLGNKTLGVSLLSSERGENRGGQGAGTWITAAPHTHTSL